MEDLCRICRKSCFHDAVPIFSDHDGVPLKQMLTKTCPIDITFDDPVSQLLPQSICTDCLEVVTAAYNLQQVCIESDKYFRLLLAGDLVTIKKDEFKVKEEPEEDIQVEEPIVEEQEIEISSIVRNKRPNPDQVLTFLVPVNKKRKLVSASTAFNPRLTQNPQEKSDPQYECNFCMLLFKEKFQAIEHMRQEHDPVQLPFGCDFCPARFRNKPQKTLHETVRHAGEDPSSIYCKVCGVNGVNEVAMQHHMIDDHKMFKIKSLDTQNEIRKLASKEPTVRTVLCDICQESCDTKKEMEKHMRTHSRPNTNFDCTICDEKFTQSINLKIHMISKHGDLTKCEKCDKSFENKSNLDYHTMMVHEGLYRELEQDEIEVCLKCCLCEVDHETEDQLMDHLDTHKSVLDAKKTKCHLCPRILPDFQNFFHHARNHAMPKTHECMVCNKRLPFNERFMPHVKYHKSYDANKAACTKCPKIFPSVKELEQHDKIKHQNETLFMCPICAKSLANSTSLSQHLRYVHNKEKEKHYKCKSCSATFINKSKLTRHEAVHRTERPHVCEVCGSSFKLQTGLNKHMKIHDPNLKKNFECKQCSSKFSEQRSLTQHMLTHSGLKPHECKFCHRAYTSKGDLVKHMQKLHVGDAIYQCDQCPRGFRVVVELREHQAEHTGDQ